MAGGVFAGGELLHEVDHEAYGTDAEEELFDDYAAGNQGIIFRAEDGEYQESYVGYVDAHAEGENGFT